MFKGYLELGGVPLINSEATEAYLDHLMPGAALKQVIKSDRIHVANEEPEYRTPVLDDAPWVNDLDEVSMGFLGLYPVDIEGLDDDTTSATVTEFLTTGGSVGTQRRASRPIRVTGILVGTSPLSVQFGRDWLTAALASGGCVDCTDGVLRYFAAEPDVCEDGAFGAEIRTDSRSFGTLGVGTYRYRWTAAQVQPAMPSRVRWQADWTEGTAIRYAAAENEGVGEYESSAVVQPLRRNWMTNPTFRSTLNGWAVSGDGTAVRQDDGGATQTYARIAASSGSFRALTGSSVSAMPAGPVVTGLTVRSRLGSSATVSLVSGGTVIGTTTLAATADWQRIFVTGTAVAGVVQVVVSCSNGGEVDFDQVTLEVGSYTGSAYFDGSTVEDGYLVVWEGGTDVSIARRTKIAGNEIQRADSAFRPTLQILSGSATNTQLVWGVRPQQGMDDQLMPYERHLFDVACTSGVKKITEVDAGNNGAFMYVEFTLVAGNPSAFMLPESINTTPLLNAPYTDPDALVLLADDDSWLSDPNSIAVTPPPKAPVIINPAIEFISTWRRYYVPIQAQAVADWAESIPTVAITSKGAAISQVRVRFHPNPFGYAPQQVDPDAFCSEFVLSYLPAQARLEVDGVAERAWASRGDKATSPADHLLYGTDGSPISWPKLSCAIPYLMTVDVPPSGTIDQFDLEVQLRRKL